MEGQTRRLLAPRCAPCRRFYDTSPEIKDCELCKRAVNEFIDNNASWIEVVGYEQGTWTIKYQNTRTYVRWKIKVNVDVDELYDFRPFDGWTEWANHYIEEMKNAEDLYNEEVHKEINDYAKLGVKAPPPRPFTPSYFPEEPLEDCGEEERAAWKLYMTKGLPQRNTPNTAAPASTPSAAGTLPGGP